MKIHQQRFFQGNTVHFSFPHASQGSCGDLLGDLKVALKLSLLFFMVSLERWSPVPTATLAMATKPRWTLGLTHRAFVMLVTSSLTP